MIDFQAAAIKATETLIKYNICFAPVMPFHILKAIPGVVAVPFAEMADRMGVDRETVVTAFGSWNQDAVTQYIPGNSRVRYLVTFNQRLPLYMQQRALARELGHIVLGHDGTRPDDVRQGEAVMFARHLLCPRPLIRAIQDAGMVITVEMLGNLTGCYERCLSSIQETPGVEVPPELNRQVKAQFAEYVRSFIACQDVLPRWDKSAVVDFGTYMEGYSDA